jgi:hypothetical protein
MKSARVQPPLRTGECSQFVAKEFQLRILHFVTQKMHTYEICSRKDKRGGNLIADALRFGQLCWMSVSLTILQLFVILRCQRISATF